MHNVVFILILFFSFDALAQPAEPAIDPNASQMASEISNEIFSPFCPGKTLAMCPSPDAAKVRRQIQQLAHDGRTKDDIKNVIIDEYGEEFRLVEPPSGDNFGLAAGLGGGLILAIVAVLFLSRRREGGTPDEKTDEETATDKEDDDEYLKEIRDEYRS